MMYNRKLDNGITIRQTRTVDASQLEQLQIIVFPTLADEERFKEAHYRRHVELFAEGQFVAERAGQIIGMTTTIRYSFDFEAADHTFEEMIAGGWLSTHQPDGAWLYGLDIGVHPAYRRMGIARALYRARQDLVEKLGLRGQVTVGMPIGYGKMKDRITAQTYFEKVRDGELKDPTISAQMRIGFVPEKLIPGYLHDPACDNYGILIIWKNDRQSPTFGHASLQDENKKFSMRTIQIKSPIPGPKSRDILARRRAAMPSGLARSTEVVVERAEGAVVYDVDGNTLLDFAAGIGMLNAGHRPERVVEAIHRQTERFIHSCALVTSYEPYVELAELLNELTPGSFPKKTLLANSGAEAVENAVKLARAYTGRQAIVTFEGGYHGRTLLTMSLTSKYGLFKKNFGPFAPEIYRLPVPNTYRIPEGMSEEQYLRHSIQQLEHALIAQVDPSAIAAVIIEPIQGEAGFLPVPAPFFRRIREICNEHGIVMIADEIQSGFGRTGRLFAIEHYDIAPDLITMAKSLGAGMPISAVTGRSDIMDAAHPGGVGGTFGGNPLACAAALETVKMIADPAFLNRSKALGQKMDDTLQRWKQQYRVIGDVRGLGAMRLVEFVTDRAEKTPAPELTLDIIREAVRNGMILIRAGLYSNCIRLLPPLVINDEQLAEGLEVLEAAIAKFEGVKEGIGSLGY